MTGEGAALVLGFGSRAFTDTALIGAVLLETWHDALQAGYSGITVMEGGADGADAACAAWAFRHRHHGVGHLPVEADWEGPCAPSCRPGHRRRRADGTTFCPAAGGYRNQDMVDRRPLIALAFIVPCTVPGCRRPRPHDSHGTADCLRRLTAASIPVRRFLP